MNVNDDFRYIPVGLPEDILRRKLYGDLDGACRLIDRRLALGDADPQLRRCLSVQREMMVRLPEDYPYTRGQALALLRQGIPDFSEEEFDQRVDEGRLGWIYLDGQPHYFDRFIDSMCKAEPAFAERFGMAQPGVESAGRGSETEKRLEGCIRRMKERGSVSLRIRIRAGVRVRDEQFKPGMFLRVHLPIPARCEQQSNIVIERLDPPTGLIALEDAPQRTVCWEGTLQENREFSVEYSYTCTARYRDGETLHGAGEQPDFFTGQEPPHIVFTPYIRALAAELAQGVADPMEKARRFYDYITLNMRYNFMPSYFSLESIPESCAKSLSGDCGVFALLFLTLCRASGVPARWQSGFAAEPDFCGGHDWVRFFVAPQGWLYADASYGVAAVRASNEERRRFYFGNIDPYRMVANNAFQADFTVEKKQWRADPYDNQVGEIETQSRGLRYAEYERSKKVLLCQEV